MSSPLYFEFLASVWDQLPEEDREVFAELWHGYEQVIASVYQKAVELNLNLSMSDLQAWSTSRWLPYTFADENKITRAATLTSNQDLSAGINTTTRSLLKLSFDDGEPFEVDIRGKLPSITKIEEIVQNINFGAGFKFASTLYENTVIRLTTKTAGPQSKITVYQTSIPAANACEFVLGVDPDNLPRTVPEFKYPYSIVYKKVSSIPSMRDAIRDESATIELTEGIDYTLETDAVCFKSQPPEKLWAERTQVDDENPWHNFGFLTDIYQKNSPRYVGVLQGLWFALWNGPKPSNVRISLYLLFGLPTAPEDAVVTAITDQREETVDDRLVTIPGTMTLLGISGTTHLITIPVGLFPEVDVGESVKLFQPLTDGIAVFDKINSPGFVEREVGRGGIQRFLTDNASHGLGDTDETKALRMLEEYTFLPQISVEAFVYPDINLKNVKIFLDAFRPLNKTYLFQVVVGVFRDKLGLTDTMEQDIDYTLGETLDLNETTYIPTTNITYYEEKLGSNVTIGLPYYEGNDVEGLDMDPHGVVMDEKLDIEVWTGRTLAYSESLGRDVWVGGTLEYSFPA